MLDDEMTNFLDLLWLSGARKFRLPDGQAFILNERFFIKRHACPARMKRMREEDEIADELACESVEFNE